MTQNKKPNRLINESSPYLRQHAYNPVDWRAWNDDTLAHAKEEGKPILLSIGYSSCHWCHVMERESFENEEVAQAMNENFICIKVDREERPDVDQVYMEAVQMMGQGGGWPLNVFLTPDQKPFYGGTYFPPENWLKLIRHVGQAFRDNRQAIEETADKFRESLSISDIVRYKLDEPLEEITLDELRHIYDVFSRAFDRKKGGMAGAPKFPMPAYWLFALRYYAASGDEASKHQALLTLKEMADGGIYDQIGGGFARYSVDAEWLVPHFEKMLYDNGQLLSLYSEGYAVAGEERFKEVVYQTVGFLEREMTSPDGGFYSALDADSEGEEGRFYVWDAPEFENVLYRAFEDEAKAALMAKYYNITAAGNWEDRKNILHRHLSPEAFALQNGLTGEEFLEIKKAADKALLEYRNGRERPGLDDKILCGWNALTLKGLVDAYKVFKDKRFKDLAIRNARFISEKLMAENRLYRNFHSGKASIPGYLEDYSLAIQAFAELYQAVFDDRWLQTAIDLTEYVLANFYDGEEGLFYYTDASSEALIARKKEIFDNVIPGSNSVMAHNLFALGRLTDRRDYEEIAISMIRQMGSLLTAEPRYLSNWASLYALMTKPVAEIAIIGKDAEQMRIRFEEKYYPHKLFAGAASKSDWPLLKDRTAIDGKTAIYVCYNKTCKLPVTSVDEALAQLV